MKIKSIVTSTISLTGLLVGMLTPVVASADTLQVSPDATSGCSNQAVDAYLEDSKDQQLYTPLNKYTYKSTCTAIRISNESLDEPPTQTDFQYAWVEYATAAGKFISNGPAIEIHYSYLSYHAPIAIKTLASGLTSADNGKHFFIRFADVPYNLGFQPEAGAGGSWSGTSGS